MWGNEKDNFRKPVSSFWLPKPGSDTPSFRWGIAMNFSTYVDVKEKMIVIFHWEWSKYVLVFCFLLFQVYHTLFMYTSLRSCQWRTKSQSFRLRFRLLSVINTSCHAYFRLSDNMWRYLEGFKPPQKRKKPEEKATYFSNYDKSLKLCNVLHQLQILQILVTLIVTGNMKYTTF